MAKDQKDNLRDERTLPLDLDGKSEREPSAREINRRIREEARAQKKLERSSSSAAGAGLGVLTRVQKRHPNNPKAQLAMFFGEFVIRAGTGRKRPVSERTNSAYIDGLIRMIDDLRADRAAVRNLGELGKTHAVRLIKYWINQGQGTATIQNKISILRRFLTFIGKENAIPKGHELRSWLNQQGVEAPMWRQTVATESKAWDEHDIDLHEILAKIRENSPITAIQLEVQAAFGLRMKESIQLNPKAADFGDILRVIHGTKGGLPRDIVLDDDPAMREWQRDVLERAKLFAEKNRKGTLSIPGKSLSQSKQHFYYQVRRVGINRADLGVTAHGLRHQYAARRYARIAGIAPPVSRDAPLHVTQDIRQADLQAREQVSRELGHFRPQVTQAYVGSLPMLERGRHQRMKDWIERTEENPQFQQAMREAGITSAWLGGRFAQGLEVDAHEKLRLIVRTGNTRPIDPQARQDLKQTLLDLYGRPVDLSEHFEEADPDDTLEIILR